MSPDFFENH